MYQKIVWVFLLFSLPSFADPQLPDDKMTTVEAVVLGLVEGVTEYLPVSSTGHLILASQAMGMGENEDYRNSVNTYLIVIQLGAILAVVTVYGEYLKKIFLGLVNKSDEGRKLLVVLVVAFIPAAIVGLFLDDLISKHLYGLWYTSAAWFLGGLALLKWNGKDDPEHHSLKMSDITIRKSFIIGCMQVIAMWPGVSRSLVTIIGGRMVGLSLHNSVVFSFLLGMLTLSAATGYKLLDSGTQMLESLGLSNILIGIAVAYFSAWIAVKTMVAYLKKHGLGFFGVYRVALALVTAFLLFQGVISP